jgi:hypothetical protein
MNQIYKSKVDAILVAPVAIILAGVSILMIRDGIWVGVLVNTIMLAGILHLFYSIRYEINDQHLSIKASFYNYPKIDIQKIKVIDLSNSWQSSPAASLDRISLQCGKQGTFTVSPKDKQAFIDHLLRINPDITIKKKTHV